MAKRPASFVSLGSLKRQQPPDPAEALAQIRRLYFETRAETIEDDLLHAIELLKSLPDEEAREKATVYMEGLSQMRRDWSARRRTRKRKS